MNALRTILGKRADIAMALLVVSILTILFTPIPAGLLDFLILANFSFALLILLLTFYMDKPVEFSTFPSMLLVATLFRLSLNIAATRLILRDGDAGRVIGAVGAHVVGGNYVIGLIVFFILVVVQYVVVTSGAQRVSEVAARFTLDSMPGQQMSIDADLNMGFIGQEEAQRRRKNLGKEAAFYGAMDGASKFVKGDAIAGIIIMLINVVGGLVIGVMQLGMPWGQALQTYTLLTIGDGIVTQIPALVISVGTGLIVTRSASDASLGQEALRQITAKPRTMLMVAGALLALTLLPGIPAVPALAIAAVIGVVSWVARAWADQPESALDQPDGEAEDSKDTYSMLTVDPVTVQLGSGVFAFYQAAEAQLLERMASFRQQYALESGLVVPAVAFKQQDKLAPNRYEISIFGIQAARGELQLDRTLAIMPAGEARKPKGIEVREPTFGLPAVWIEGDEYEAAKALRCTLIDPMTVLITHLGECLRLRAAELLTRKETDRLLGRVRERQPGLVEEFVPTSLAVSDVQHVLQNLLKEAVSIRHMDAIMEILADRVRHTKDPILLTEAVRQKLGAAICQDLAGDRGHLQVMTLDAAVEQRLLQVVRDAESTGAFAIDPRFAEQLVAKLAQHCERMIKSNAVPVLLASPELRRHIRSLAERAAPHLRVLSMSEVPPNVELRAFGAVAV
jgi:flagellar biosynthesis protein FlhA